MTITIRYNKLTVIVDKKEESLMYIDCTHIRGWMPNSTFKGATMDLDIDGFNNFLYQCNHFLKYDITLDSKVNSWYKEECQKQKLATFIHQNKFQLKDKDLLNEELKDYQIQAIAFFKAMKCALIGYGMGLGKTAIAVNCMKIIKAQKVLYVVPSYLKYSTAIEIHKWSNLETQVVDGTPVKRQAQLENFKNENKKVLIINYEQLRIARVEDKITCKTVNDIKINKIILDTKWDMIIWDEAHRLKNEESQTARGASYLKAEYKLMLTGTPGSKHPGDIYNLLKILDKKSFNSYWGFINHFFNTIQGFRDIVPGYLKKPQQFQKLLERYMIRKTKQDVLDLPEKIMIDVPVKMSDKQFKVYQKAENDYLKPAPEGEDIILTDVERFIRLNQISMASQILDENSKTPSIVIDTTLDILEDIPDRCIVSATYINMSGILHNRISKKFKDRQVYLVNSKISNHKRNDIIEEFKENPTGILVTTIKCLSEGFNIDCCNNIIFTDLDWNSGINLQHQERIHRMTTTEQKYYYQIIVEDTVNEYKWRKVAKEQNHSEFAFNDTEANICSTYFDDFRKELRNKNV